MLHNEAVGKDSRALTVVIGQDVSALKEAEEAQPGGCHIPNVVPLEEKVSIPWPLYIELKRLH